MAERTAAKRVLIIEDHADTAEMVALVLQGQGLLTTRADSGRAALDSLANEGLPDVILLDLMLPEMDGLEIIEEARKRTRALPPIVIMSAKPRDALEQARRQTGAMAVIRKPFEVDDITSAVDAALHSSE